MSDDIGKGGQVPESQMQMMGSDYCCPSCAVGQHGTCSASQPCPCPGCK
jgi:hypothetical protein